MNLGKAIGESLQDGFLVILVTAVCLTGLAFLVGALFFGEGINPGEEFTTRQKLVPAQTTFNAADSSVIYKYVMPEDAE